MAAALVHLFSSAAFDAQHDEIVSEDADKLFQWLARWLWGDAMRVGRHDWVCAGCPVTVEDFCTGIRTLSGAEFDSLGRILTISDQPEMLASRSTDVSVAAIERLEELVAKADVQAQSSIRERLYDILLRYPSPEAVSVLEKCAKQWPDWDGDSNRPIGTALADALTKCQETARSETAKEQR